LKHICSFEKVNAPTFVSDSLGSEIYILIGDSKNVMMAFHAGRLPVPSQLKNHGSGRLGYAGLVKQRSSLHSKDYILIISQKPE
jgi:hypothetical protein